MKPEELLIPATEVEIADSIADSCRSTAMTIRRLAFQLDKANAELETTADKLSDVWIHLDAFARGETFTSEMAASILRHQKAPGWKS